MAVGVPDREVMALNNILAGKCIGLSMVLADKCM